METCWKVRYGNVECRERSLWRLIGGYGSLTGSVKLTPA